MEVSRTSKSIKNSLVAMVIFAIQFFLGFYSRKVFLDYLGEEILGLNTTAVNILQFLNLAEFGITAAVVFSLYNPLHNKHYDKINEIVSLQGKLFRRVAIIIILGACVVMCFFPLIFHKMQLPLWYAYASFGVLLFSSLLGYFVNYRQIVLTAAQMDYKIQYSVGLTGTVKVIAQIISLSSFTHPYIWWLVLEVVFTIISSIVLQIVIRKNFPFLKDVSLSYKQLKEKNVQILNKTKQVFFHNIGGFALSQSSPIIIYAYASLSVVTLYGNYLLISNGILRLVNAMFNGMAAGVGDLIAEGDKGKIINVFYQIFSLRFYICAVLAYAILVSAQQFIKVWIGSQYLLSFSTLAIIVATLFIRLNRFTVTQFLSGRGQFQDIWSPLVEASLNVGLSILLGYFFGLNGILSGVLISLIVVVEIWKPIFLFRFGLHESILKYFVNYGIHILLAFITGIGTWIIFSKIFPQSPDNLWEWMIFSAGTTSLFSVFLAVSLFILNTSFRRCILRIKSLKNL